MNNTQFRRLVLDTPGAGTRRDGDGSGATPRGGATPALGSRMRSNIPMTPRSIAGSSSNEFARQLAERNASLNPSANKKFRSIAAPKGTKLGSGYQDRTKLLTSDEDDDKARRVKALEEMVKLGQMERATFEALRDEIVGGDISNVHLVKGLDRKLLDRVRRGEDVLSTASGAKSTAEESDPKQGSPGAGVDVDEEFETIENKDIQPIAKQERAKQGEMAPPPQVAGQKRTRNDILKELRASRLAAAEAVKQAAAPALGPRFTKFGQKKETSRIERDERGREVLITVDENGKVKRKVKKATTRDETPQNHGLLMPDKDAQPLGMEVAVPAAPEEDLDADIFEGVGADYDPLSGPEDDDDDSEDLTEPNPDTKSEPVSKSANGEPRSPPPPDKESMPPPPLPHKSSVNRRNYFGDTDEKKDHEPEVTNNITDPTILAALKKASTINPLPSGNSMAENEEEAAKVARRKKMLEVHDRDADDMDLGFGSSRFGDEEEAEGKKVKLSVWGKDDGKDDRHGDGKGPRKRGPKKRKGDANSAADVLKVMERRKAEGK